MHEPAERSVLLLVAVRRQQAPHGHAVDGQPLARAEVGQQQHPDRVSGRSQPRCRPDSALEAQTAHSRPRTDRAFGRRRPADRGSRRHEGGTHVLGGHLHPARIVEKAVVALGDDRDDHLIGADRRVLGDQKLAGGVVHAPQLHRRGQEHRGLGQTPLARSEKSRALPRPVEDGAARWHGAPKQVAAQVDDGHAGPGYATAGGRWPLVAPHGGVTDAHAGHVDYRSSRATGQNADPDPELRCTCHPMIITHGRR